MKHFSARFRPNQRGTFRKSVRDEYGIAVPWCFGCCRIPQDALDQSKILPKMKIFGLWGGKAQWSLHRVDVLRSGGLLQSQGCLVCDVMLP